MSGKSASVLQPAKFLLMILQIIAISSILNMKNQFIIDVAVPARLKNDEIYDNAVSSMTIWSGLAVIILLVEFLIIFSGKTLFNDKYNILVIGSHILGLAMTAMFMQQKWHYTKIFWIFIVSAAIPCFLEASSLMFQRSNFRNQAVVV